MKMTDPPSKAFDSSGATDGRDAAGKFIVGHKKSRGRPKGSRTKLAEDVVADVLESWREHGPAVLQRLAFSDPGKYADFIAKVLPKEIKVEHSITDSLSDDELERMLAIAERTAAGAGVIEGQVRNVTPTLAPPLDEVLTTAAEQRDALARSQRSNGLESWHAETYPAEKVMEQLVQTPLYPVGPGVPLSAREEERRNIAKLYEAEIDPKDLF